jgi:predicted DNA-binding transcriptional regulator YafY
MMTAALIDSDLLSYTDIRHRIILEDIPSGKKFLSSILEAMKLNHLLEVEYKLYNRPEASKHTLVPLRVQLFERRWYLTCKINSVIQTIPLDCIQTLEILDETFDPNQYRGMFVPKEYTKHRYGTATHLPFAGLKEVDIKIKVDGDYADFFRKLPIHGSQKEIEQKTEYSIFHYRVGPSIEFMQALLHHGPHVEVLKPESVRNKMKEMIREMGDIYR